MPKKSPSPVALAALLRNGGKMADKRTKRLRTRAAVKRAEISAFR